MAAADLPCNGAGVCMVCRVAVTSEVDLLRCSTCGTPWHSPCLSNPPALSDAATWSCPDCSSDPTATARAAAPAAAGGELVAAIREIEADTTLSDAEKARRRQNLLAGRSAASDAAPDDVVDDSAQDDGVLNILKKSFSCLICIKLLDRPVTTPCGHNFCLKCFNGWTREGKRACAKCRKPIPSKMVVEQPRINSKIVEAIRKARMSKATNSTSSVNVDKPDKAYTTERAKRAGIANASSGKIFVTTAQDHFGPILAEHDPKNNTGIKVGDKWENRLECRQWGVHWPHIGGIAGQSSLGAQSVALSGGYEDDEDHGDWFLYTGSGGRDLSGNRRTNKEQGFDQAFVKANEALRKSCLKGYPVRVVRSHKEKRSSYAPESGVRYNGIYRVEKCWRKICIQGKFQVCRYLFVRCDNEPAPWTSDAHGDRPRPLPDIEELKDATDINERYEQPAWAYNEKECCWKWMSKPPTGRKAGKQGTRRARSDDEMSNAEKLLKDFSCSICHKVMTEPLSAPCGDNFCKTCLLGAYDNQSSVRERSSGGRTLRAQKIMKRCPSCKTDISDFVADPQINRDMMGAIESLQLKVKEDNNTTKEIPYGGGDTAEEFDDADQEEFNVEEGDSDEDLEDNPADTDTEGNIVVGIKDEDQQPGQKRKADADMGIDGPTKRMTTSGDDDVELNSKSDDAE